MKDWLIDNRAHWLSRKETMSDRLLLEADYISLSFLTLTSQHQYSDEDPGADMSQVRGREKPGLGHLAEEESGHSPRGGGLT